MRARLTAVLALSVATAAGVATAGTLDAAVPRERRVVMFADSVGLGARTALPRAFPSDWSVHVDGRPARFVEQIEDDFVRPRLATDPHWFGDHVVIAAGYNYPFWDPDRFERSIDSLIDTLTAAGVRHVHWVTLREVKPEFISPGAWRQIQPYYWYFPEVNDHLEAALERHDNLRLVDWAAVADRPGITYDAIHLNIDGATLYSGIVRAAVDAAATSVDDRSTTRVAVPGATGDLAAVVNITTTDPRRNGHLRLWNCEGDPPTVSMHSHVRDQTVAHAGIAPLNDDGEFCVYARTSTNLVVDVTGTFTAAAGLSTAPPARLLDSRTGPPIPARAITEIDDRPPGAVALTATALGGDEQGWLRLAGCDGIADDGTASVNHPVGAPTPNLVIVRPDADGRICVTNRVTTHVIVDRFASFADTGTIAVGSPVRWFDSRDRPAPIAAGSVTSLDLADAGVDLPSGAPAGVIVNITSVDASDRGFVTGYSCDRDRPTTANVNTSGGVVSNAAIIALDDSSTLCLFNRSEMHLVVDLMGTVHGDGFSGRVPIRVLDTRG